MPPTRRSRVSSGPAAKGAQKTLSFGGTKITKPTSSAKSIDKSIDKSPLSSTLTPPSTIDTGHITSEAAVEQQAKVELKELAKGKTAEEERASRVTDAQIKRYWRERENERKSRRVHQEELSLEEKVLRLFDMSSQYGPAIGIARMKRWVRANKLGLSPPIEVLAVLLKEEEKGNTKIERAYVDELMSSKFIIGEA
ncbi:related to DNA polymerase delta subunit 4 [Phialocephala subalpina]|uniref:Related to DNA polymerase delta subunit 4 n=1 Tax=Phialocephala subalpina TaxID=576137 RepID=A0A1L7WGN7_9HELO|nr:related to DNA polymerase delta subunit 4 [Phialocephala subalpina]